MGPGSGATGFTHRFSVASHCMSPNRRPGLRASSFGSRTSLGSPTCSAPAAAGAEGQGWTPIWTRSAYLHTGPRQLKRRTRETGHTTVPDRIGPAMPKKLLASREASTHGSSPGERCLSVFVLFRYGRQSPRFLHTLLRGNDPRFREGRRGQRPARQGRRGHRRQAETRCVHAVGAGAAVNARHRRRSKSGRLHARNGYGI